MKYWIYKDSRILGPYERDAISGLPGFDAGTLVCAGESAGAAEGQWAPASDIPELAPLTLGHGPAWSPDAPTSSFGLLDKLQIESAGLIGDEQYPSAGEVLFQDAEIKRSFAELLVQRTRTDDTEVRRLRGLVSELSVQLELMYRRIAQLENTHTDFLQRLNVSETVARPGPAAPEPVLPVSAAPVPAPAPAPSPVAPPAAPAAIVAPVISFAAPVPANLPTPAAPPVISAPPAVMAAAPTAMPDALFPAPRPRVDPSLPLPSDPFAAEWPKLPLPGANFPNFSAFQPPTPAPSAPAQPEIPVLKQSAEAAAPAPAPAEPISAPAVAAEAFSTQAAAPIPAVPIPPVPEAAVPEPVVDAAAPIFDEAAAAPTPELPPFPSFSAPSEAAAPPFAPPADALAPETPVAAPATARKLVFDKPKTLRVVPTLKTFKVVDPASAASAEQASAAPSAAAPEPTAPESIAPPSPEMPSLAPASAEGEAHAPLPDIAPLAAAPIPAPAPAFAIVEPPSIAPAPIPVPMPSPAAEAPLPSPSPSPSPSPAAAPSPLPEPAILPQMASFPATGSLPVAGGSGSPEPPVTAVFAQPTFGAGPSAPASLPATQEVLARLAKPAAPAPSVARPPRSNKKFLFIGGLGAVAAVFVVTLFLRHTRSSDLNHMASLDDGKPQLGAEPVDDSTRPPVVKPPMAAAPAAPAAPAMPAMPAAPAPAMSPTSVPAQAPAAGMQNPTGPAPAPMTAEPAPAPEPQAPAAPSPLDAATNFVKNFPLDGDRGTVSKWLDYSYLASPDAGQGTWTATEQSDGTYLVEYRFSAAVKGAPEILYLFVADPDRGYVLGKNRDAKDLLAGGGPRMAGRAAVAAAPRKKAPARKRKPAKTRARAASSGDTSTKAVPQLPLPTDGELHAPAEDDGDFGSDTIKSEQ